MPGQRKRQVPWDASWTREHAALRASYPTSQVTKRPQIVSKRIPIKGGLPNTKEPSQKGSDLRAILIAAGATTMVAVILLSILVVTGAVMFFRANNSSSPTRDALFVYGKIYDYHGYPIAQSRANTPNTKDDVYVRVATLKLQLGKDANSDSGSSILMLSFHDADPTLGFSMTFASLTGVYMLDKFGMRFSAVGIDKGGLALSPGQDDTIEVRFPLIFEIDSEIYLYFDPSPGVLETHCAKLLPTGKADICNSNTGK